MKYGIYLPSGNYGYSLLDINNANIDINLIFEDNSIFCFTLFTLSSIKNIMEREQSIYFWSSDMIIVENLSKTSILSAIEKIVEKGYYKYAGTKIGYYGEESYLPEYYDENSWLLKLDFRKNIHHS